MQSESMEIIISPVDCSSALHTVRALPLFSIPFHSHFDIGEVALRFEHPLVAIIRGTVVLRDHLKPIIWVVATTDALNRFVNRLALVVARHQDADRRLIAVVFLNFRAGD